MEDIENLFSILEELQAEEQNYITVLRIADIIDRLENVLKIQT